VSDAEANVAVIQALHEAWSSGEFGEDLFHQDVEWSTPHPGGTVHGRDELMAFLRSFMGAWAEYRNELEEVRVLPDGRLLVLFNEVGLGRTSGVRTELNPGALVDIRDGLIYRYVGMDRDEAMAEAGLAE
jgi:ketosteroid isomerase-like protein